MFVKTLNISLAEWIKIPSESLTPQLEHKLHERLVFTNPDYELRHNRGEWIGSIPPQINCLRQSGRTYLLPRGFLDQLIGLCKRFQQPFRIVDRRRSFEPLPIEFHGELKSYQKDAADAALDQSFATVVGGHKSGKKVIALYTIAQRRQPTLILIPRLDLFDGWLSKIENFLHIPRSEVGIFANGVHQIGEHITIAHTGEVMRYWRKICDRVGYLIVDECHHSTPKVLTYLIPKFDSRYMLGLSKTTQRRNRLSKLVQYYVGDVVYTIDSKDPREDRGIIRAHVVARPTEFEYNYQYQGDYTSMLEALMKDRARTVLIVDDIETEMKQARQSLIVLMGGKEQEGVLGAQLQKRGIAVLNYSRPSVFDTLSAEEQTEGCNQTEASPQSRMPTSPAVVLVTDQTLAQCAQHVRAPVLFLAVPVYFPKSMANAIRSLQPNGKAAENRLKIYDYVDKRVGLLESYFRMRTYNYGIPPDTLLDPKPNHD